MSTDHDRAWSEPEKVAELCRSSGSRPEVGGIDGGNGGQDNVAGTSTELRGPTARDERAGATICTQKLVGEDSSSAATTSRDTDQNPILMGRGAREEES